MNVLITGYTGLVANSLRKFLTNKGYKVFGLSRKPASRNCYYWNPDNSEVDPIAFKDKQHIIHLAGAGVADKRWSSKRKLELYNSRIKSSDFLYREISKLEIKPQTFTSASAIGIYGHKNGEYVFIEEDQNSSDFLGTLCHDWEKSALNFNNLNIKTSIVRTGIVLDKTRGALPKIVSPVKYYLGAPLASGKQYMPWIHIEDLCSIYEFIFSNRLEGAFNAVAPEFITNKIFTKKVASVINRPLLLPNVPKSVLRLLFGKMADILIYGNKISSEKIISEGFQFKYKNLDSALNNILKST